MWYQRSQCYLDKLFNFSTLYTVTFSPFLALEQARARRWARTQGSRVCFSSIAKIAPESPLLCLYVPGCQQLLPNCFLERAWGMGPPCPGSPLRALRQSRLLPHIAPGAVPPSRRLPMSCSSWKHLQNRTMFGRNTRILLGISAQGGKSNPLSLPGS